MSIIRHFEKNIKGRDFVVGDIHGCFAEVAQQLNHLAFNGENGDRLFSVGDLIDRGQNSDHALSWINMPWFHAVRGNHEDMAIGVFDKTWDAGNYSANGGAWFLDLAPDIRAEYIDAFKSLPIAIEVATENGLVGIVHADCPTDQWSDMHTGLETSGQNNFEMMCLWNRSRYMQKRSEIVSGVHEVIVGHAPVTEQTRLGNVRYIDTGAVYGGKLTIIQI